MKALNKILSIILAALVGIMVLACCWQVITRFVLNNPSKYTEEFLRYALIWLTMLGAPYAYGQHKHLAINLLSTGFTRKGKDLDQLFVEVVILILSIVVFIAGGIMVTQNAAGQMSAAMKIPMEFYYVCIPIGGCLMVIYCIDHILKLIKDLKEGK